MEHNVQQRSREWYELRRGMVVTGSRFADAVGAGKGKPFDFLKSLFHEDDCGDVDNVFTRQGTEMEPIIHEAYDLLTGYKTRQSGFWTLRDEQNPLKGNVGVSPDAIVVDPATGKLLGVCEFKSPLYSMYREVPRQYMVQMHGHMAVTGSKWCDFMAVCKLRRQVMLQRVHFCLQFWNAIAKRLEQFCTAYNEFSSGTTSSKHIEVVKKWSVTTYLPFETKIQVTNMLRSHTDHTDIFCGPSGHSFNFDFLMGSYVVNKSDSESVCSEEVLRRLDDSIEDEKSLEAAMLAYPC